MFKIFGCASAACSLLIASTGPSQAADATLVSLEADASAPADVVPQWGTLDLSLLGPKSGNPFVDVQFSATFEIDGQSKRVTGFYDGDGVFRVRFCPDKQGAWKYVTHSSAAELDGKTGQFTVGPPGKNNHGPVLVHKTFHFAYADGEPYKPIGTTCYAWTSQPESLEEQTLKTLASAPFNKLRMCVFPKRYDWNMDEPPLYAFEGTPPNRWDFTRFNPAFFHHLERRILQLRDMGIECDLILFHPYDMGHWGFDRMPDDADDRYLRYVIARLSAIRNVWWSLANEYDFMKEKQESDWDRFFDIVKESDPYHRLCSIHNGTLIYNHTNPVITHASIQNGSAVEDPARAMLYRDVYRKPIVFDEVKYEGDIPKRWGNLSAQEMVHRFWCGTVAGTYVGHGECYLSSDDVLWWAKGGVLKGESPARIAFLRDVLATAPRDGIEPIDKWQNPEYGGKRGEYYLVYLGKATPTEWTVKIPDKEMKVGAKFHVDVLDTWNMTVEPVAEPVTLKRASEYFLTADDGRTVKLPGRPYMALRITRVNAQ